MKKIARLLFVPVLLMVVFSLMPTGSSTDEVLAGYQSTTSFSASGSSYLLYMMQFRLAKDSDYDAKFASSIGQSISALAVDLCEQLGNGGNTSYSEGERLGSFGIVHRVPVTTRQAMRCVVALSRCCVTHQRRAIYRVARLPLFVGKYF